MDQDLLCCNSPGNDHKFAITKEPLPTEFSEYTLLQNRV